MLHLAHTSKERMDCHFITLVIRNESLNRLYAGGLRGFHDVNPSRCNRDISVDCYMGSDIEDTVRDLTAAGLVRGTDFTIFDAVRPTMHPFRTTRRESIDTGAPWLKATCAGGNVYVWYDHAYRK